MSIELIEKTDALGNVITVKEYYWGRYRVREWPDGSVLVEFKLGRWRSYDADHWVSKACAQNSCNPNGPFTSKFLQDEQRRHKAGTHEPVTYYLDQDGRVGVPPDPSLPPPDNVTIHTANTLAEIDKLSATMKEQMYNEFQDGGVATAYWDRVFGFDREQMSRGAKTEKGREMLKLMREDLDKEERDRQRISTEAIFHFREFDGR